MPPLPTGENKLSYATSFNQLTFPVSAVILKLMGLGLLVERSVSPPSHEPNTKILHQWEYRESRILILCAEVVEDR